MRFNFSFKTAKLDKKRQIIVLNFPSDNVDLLETLLDLGNMEQRYDEKWEIPVSEKVIAKLKKLKFEFCNDLKSWQGATNYAEMPLKMHIPEPKNGYKLYPYQKQGVQFITERKGRALIADEMGLGKTVQALTWLEINPKVRPVLIICPSSLKINWKREAEKWVTNADVTILEGLTPYKFTGNIVIINYDILHNWTKVLKNYGFECMVVDEVHNTKNPAARRTKALKRLNKYVDKIIALSGTPIENKPVELYNIIQIINPDLFPNYYSYLHRFCGAKRNFYGALDTNGATNTMELNRILKKTIMIRRKKVDVLKDLPSKQIVNVPLKITNGSEYQKAEKEFIQFIKERYGSHIDDNLKTELKNFAKRHKIETTDDLSDSEIDSLRDLKVEKVSAAPALAKIESLKQLAAAGKTEEIKNWIETFLESGEKLVVFAIHAKIIAELMQHFPGAVKIDGTVTDKKRQQAVDKFQKDPKTKLLIANMKAGGVGLTLTAASNIAIIQLPWSPSVLNQAIDRVHRITQVKQVTAWILLAENTIEEKILALLKQKENILSEVLDGEPFKDMSILMSLINSYAKIKSNGKEQI